MAQEIESIGEFLDKADRDMPIVISPYLVKKSTDGDLECVLHILMENGELTYDRGFGYGSFEAWEKELGERVRVKDVSGKIREYKRKQKEKIGTYASIIETYVSDFGFNTILNTVKEMSGKVKFKDPKNSDIEIICKSALILERRIE